MQRTKNPTPINDYGLPNIVIPAEVIFNENLTWTERALFGFVQNLTRNEYGFAWASNRMLGRHIGCNPETVSTMLSKLHKEGYLILEYETTWDGRNVRKIYLDGSYMLTHEETLKEGLRKIKTPHKQKQNPPFTEVKSPIYTSKRKLESNLENELENSVPSGTDNVTDDNPSHNGEEEPTRKERLSPQERAKQFLPQSETLANIIRSTKNIKVPHSKLKSWANEIRKLVETDGVDPSRIDSVLSWYSENIGGEYVPVVESGAALRGKFIKLEDAIQRGNGNGKKSQPNQNADPEQILTEYVGNGKPPKLFIDRCFNRAKDLIDSSNNGNLPALAENMGELYQWTHEKQSQDYDDRYSYTPISLIIHYLNWIEDNDWIKDKDPSLFRKSSKLFSKFLKEEAQHNFDRDPVTGKMV